MPRIRAVLAAAFAVAVTIPATASAKDFAIVARDIVPSGERSGSRSVPGAAEEHGRERRARQRKPIALGERRDGGAGGGPGPREFAVRYCGGGNLKRCRAQLWAALDAAGRQLAAQQGPNPAAWRASATRERITFIPGLLKTTMRYTNRPGGIQQVLSFSGHSPETAFR